MPFDSKKPFMIIYENGTSVIIQDGKKYTLSGVEIKESTKDNTNEPTTTQEQNTTDSSKKQSRSKK